MKKTKLLQSMLLASAVAASSLSAPLMAADVPAGTKLADVQEFVRDNGAEPGSLDPQKIEGVPGANIARDLFEGLLNQSRDGKEQPGVATSWSANADNTVYTFNLRKDAKWSNGDTVTAHDFVYAWQRAVDPALASPYSWYMEIPMIVNASKIVGGEAEPSSLGVRAVDDFTFEVTLEGPVPFFVKMVTHTTMFPVHKATVEAHGDKWTQPENIVTNGAYTLAEWKINERMELTRNTNYWNDAKTVINKVTHLPIEAASASLARYRADELDFGNFPTEQIKQLRKEMGDEIYITPKLCTYYYILNTQVAPYGDARVRKALSYAIDRDIITEHITATGQLPAYGLTPEIIANFDPQAPAYASMSQADRVAEATKLMAEAGYSDSNPLNINLLYNTSEGHKKIAIAISQMWKKDLPVETSLENQEWKTYLSSRNEGNFTVARAGWCGDYNEASTFLDLMTSTGMNDGKWINAEYDELMAASKTMSDPSANYNRAEEILAEEMPIIPIYQYTGVNLIKPRVGGYAYDNPEGNVYSRDVYIKAE
ncbi:MAG: ABC transporter substrate-binding protein [Gammaproteobacteria bacterium]|jgi:oligopeptide transport system substrate-binding protein|nr:ABC transporter substrate-binding protein [Gammaproteobacteria bacterium]